MDRKPVLVTTEFRGVFFGYAEKTDGENIELFDARCAIMWNTTGGFLELAEKGPNSGSKIGSKAPKITLRKVASVADVTPEAEKAWNAC